QLACMNDRCCTRTLIEWITAQRQRPEFDVLCAPDIPHTADMPPLLTSRDELFPPNLHLTHAHRAYASLVAKLDMRIDAQIMSPGRISRRSSLRPDKNIVIAVLDAHQRCLPNRTRLIAPVSHDDYR